MKYSRITIALTTLVCIFSILLLGFMIVIVYYFVAYPLKYQQQILLYSTQYHLDSALVGSLINVESSFNPQATSSKGARGLMQIMPATGQYIADSLGQMFDPDNLYNVDTNIQYGCFYLRYLFDKFDNLDLVLASYNAGEGVVSNWLKNKKYSPDGKTLHYIPYSQTAKYLHKVKRSMPIYQNKLT